MKIWVSHRMLVPLPLPGPRITPADLEQGVGWPYPPEWIIRFAPGHASYVVDVEIATEEGGKTALIGIAVRSGIPTSPAGTPKDPWLEGAEYEPVVPREVQRLPLGRYARAGLAIANDPFTAEGRREIQRILVPKGRPSRGRGAEFYLDLLATARSLEEQGIRPVPEIARRKKVSENLVHQWLHRARKLETRSSPPSEKSQAMERP